MDMNNKNKINELDEAITNMSTKINEFNEVVEKYNDAVLNKKQEEAGSFVPNINALAKEIFMNKQKADLLMSTIGKEYENEIT